MAIKIPPSSRTQEAIDTPFDGSSAVPPFTSEEANSGIIEARDTAPGLNSRYVAIAGFAGNAPNNTYLQWFRSNPSNIVPFPIAESSSVIALAIATNGNSTCTVALLKNGSSITTISLTAEPSKIATGLNLPLLPNDLLSARVVSGSASSPNFYVSVKVVQ